MTATCETAVWAAGAIGFMVAGLLLIIVPLWQILRARRYKRGY